MLWSTWRVWQEFTGGARNPPESPSLREGALGNQFLLTGVLKVRSWLLWQQRTTGSE